MFTGKEIEDIIKIEAESGRLSQSVQHTISGLGLDERQAVAVYMEKAVALELERAKDALETGDTSIIEIIVSESKTPDRFYYPTRLSRTVILGRNDSIINPSVTLAGILLTGLTIHDGATQTMQQMAQGENLAEERRLKLLSAKVDLMENAVALSTYRELAKEQIDFITRLSKLPPSNTMRSLDSRYTELWPQVTKLLLSPPQRHI